MNGKVHGSSGEKIRRSKNNLSTPNQKGVSQVASNLLTKLDQHLSVESRRSTPEDIRNEFSKCTGEDVITFIEGEKPKSSGSVIPRQSKLVKEFQDADLKNHWLTAAKNSNNKTKELMVRMLDCCLGIEAFYVELGLDNGSAVNGQELMIALKNAKNNSDVERQFNKIKGFLEKIDQAFTGSRGSTLSCGDTNPQHWAKQWLAVLNYEESNNTNLFESIANLNKPPTPVARGGDNPPPPINTVRDQPGQYDQSEQKPATIIQKMFRGNRARKRVRERVRKLDRETKSARDIQRVYRGFVSRTNQQSLTNVADALRRCDKEKCVSLLDSINRISPDNKQEILSCICNTLSPNAKIKISQLENLNDITTELIKLTQQQLFNLYCQESQFSKYNLDDLNTESSQQLMTLIEQLENLVNQSDNAFITQYHKNLDQVLDLLEAIEYDVKQEKLASFQDTAFNLIQVDDLDSFALFVDNQQGEKKEKWNTIFKVYKDGYECITNSSLEDLDTELAQQIGRLKEALNDYDVWKLEKDEHNEIKGQQGRVNKEILQHFLHLKCSKIDEWIANLGDFSSEDPSFCSTIKTLFSDELETIKSESTIDLSQVNNRFELMRQVLEEAKKLDLNITTPEAIRIRACLIESPGEIVLKNQMTKLTDLKDFFKKINTVVKFQKDFDSYMTDSLFTTFKSSYDELKRGSDYESIKGSLTTCEKLIDLIEPKLDTFERLKGCQDTLRRLVEFELEAKLEAKQDQDPFRSRQVDIINQLKSECDGYLEALQADSSEDINCDSFFNIVDQHENYLTLHVGLSYIDELIQRVGEVPFLVELTEEARSLIDSCSQGFSNDIQEKFTKFCEKIDDVEEHFLRFYENLNGLLTDSKSVAEQALFELERLQSRLINKNRELDDIFAQVNSNSNNKRALDAIRNQLITQSQPQLLQLIQEYPKDEFNQFSSNFKHLNELVSNKEILITESQHQKNKELRQLAQRLDQASIKFKTMFKSCHDMNLQINNTIVQNKSAIQIQKVVRSKRSQINYRARQILSSFESNPNVVIDLDQSINSLIFMKEKLTLRRETLKRRLDVLKTRHLFKESYVYMKMAIDLLSDSALDKIDQSTPTKFKSSLIQVIKDESRSKQGPELLMLEHAVISLLKKKQIMGHLTSVLDQRAVPSAAVLNSFVPDRELLKRPNQRKLEKNLPNLEIEMNRYKQKQEILLKQFFSNQDVIDLKRASKQSTLEQITTIQDKLAKLSSEKREAEDIVWSIVEKSNQFLTGQINQQIEDISFNTKLQSELGKLNNIVVTKKSQLEQSIKKRLKSHLSHIQFSGYDVSRFKGSIGPPALLNQAETNLKKAILVNHELRFNQKLKVYLMRQSAQDFHSKLEEAETCFSAIKKLKRESEIKFFTPGGKSLSEDMSIKKYEDMIDKLNSMRSDLVITDQHIKAQFIVEYNQIKKSLLTKYQIKLDELKAQNREVQRHDRGHQVRQKELTKAKQKKSQQVQQALLREEARTNIYKQINNLKLQLCEVKDLIPLKEGLQFDLSDIQSFLDEFERSTSEQKSSSSENKPDSVDNKIDDVIDDLDDGVRHNDKETVLTNDQLLTTLTNLLARGQADHIVRFATEIVGLFNEVIQIQRGNLTRQNASNVLKQCGTLHNKIFDLCESIKQEAENQNQKKLNLAATKIQTLFRAKRVDLKREPEALLKQEQEFLNQQALKIINDFLPNRDELSLKDLETNIQLLTQLQTFLKTPEGRRSPNSVDDVEGKSDEIDLIGLVTGQNLKILKRATNNNDILQELETLIDDIQLLFNEGSDLADIGNSINYLEQNFESRLQELDPENIEHLNDIFGFDKDFSSEIDGLRTRIKNASRKQSQHEPDQDLLKRLKNIKRTVNQTLNSLKERASNFIEKKIKHLNSEFDEGFKNLKSKFRTLSIEDLKHIAEQDLYKAYNESQPNLNVFLGLSDRITYLVNDHLDRVEYKFTQFKTLLNQTIEQKRLDALQKEQNALLQSQRIAIEGHMGKLQSIFEQDEFLMSCICNDQHLADSIKKIKLEFSRSLAKNSDFSQDEQQTFYDVFSSKLRLLEEKFSQKLKRIKQEKLDLILSPTFDLSLDDESKDYSVYISSKLSLFTEYLSQPLPDFIPEFLDLNFLDSDFLIQFKNRKEQLAMEQLVPFVERFSELISTNSYLIEYFHELIDLFEAPNQETLRNLYSFGDPELTVQRSESGEVSDGKQSSEDTFNDDVNNYIQQITQIESLDTINQLITLFDKPSSLDQLKSSSDQLKSFILTYNSLQGGDIDADMLDTSLSSLDPSTIDSSVDQLKESLRHQQLKQNFIRQVYSFIEALPTNKYTFADCLFHFEQLQSSFKQALKDQIESEINSSFRTPVDPDSLNDHFEFEGFELLCKQKIIGVYSKRGLIAEEQVPFLVELSQNPSVSESKAVSESKGDYNIDTFDDELQRCVWFYQLNQKILGEIPNNWKEENPNHEKDFNSNWEELKSPMDLRQHIERIEGSAETRRNIASFLAVFQNIDVESSVIQRELDSIFDNDPDSNHEISRGQKLEAAKNYYNFLTNFESSLFSSGRSKNTSKQLSAKILLLQYFFFEENPDLLDSFLKS
ncbi:hypothetical protein DID75_04420 [Candidatus Marinamargulisbacteria bacterium SCGC AG-410-N11]|nr:hypothetical protein DID75_04420 [Candidatus Marinamargulisbacteria bacterium SCGC AG-410-N11]